jgi:hypothetical protein
MCRREHPREEVGVVQYTAVTRWDALLDVAKVWAAIDLRRGEETSEEEKEEEWLDDGDTDSRCVCFMTQQKCGTYAFLAP